jgi:hypothetical protein
LWCGCQFAEEEATSAKDGDKPTGTAATQALFREAQAKGGMQQAYLSPASDQEFNAKLEALKASTGAPAKLAMPKGVSPLDDGAVTSAAPSHRTCRVREVVRSTHTRERRWAGAGRQG